MAPPCKLHKIKHEHYSIVIVQPLLTRWRDTKTLLLTEYSSKMSLQCLQYCHLDFSDGLAQELLAGSREKLVFVHYFALCDAGDGQRNTLGSLNVFTHRI